MDTNTLNRIMLLLGRQDFTQNSITNAENISEDGLAKLTTSCKLILKAMCEHSDLLLKYELSSADPGSPMIYVNSSWPRKYFFSMEAFPKLAESNPMPAGRQVEELVYEKMFEAVILRYTKSNSKPNQVLRDTRSSEFCYRLAIKVEALPSDVAQKPNCMTLLREFLILHYIWEYYRSELKANVCGPDQLIGFPMPFQFRNVVGCADYDFVEDHSYYTYYNIRGVQEKLLYVKMPRTIPDVFPARPIGSTLSYMAFERLGPSLSYLMELMRSQSKTFTMSSALKIYDQIICRLMVMHKYGVVHCNPNPSCFCFGPGESCNVLYISDFSCSIVNPEPSRQVLGFQDRFVSYLRFRRRSCHFVHDLESAFYILFCLILGRLPWDTRFNGSASPNENANPQSADLSEFSRTHNDRSTLVDEKEKFWQNSDIINRAFRMMDLELNDPMYQTFSTDILESLYSRTKECIQTGSSISPANYANDICVTNNLVYNFYFGLRKVLATYFRFESLSSSLKDQQGSIKVEQLTKDNVPDLRVAWDLSHWCWNHLECRPPGYRQSTISRMISIKSR